MRWFALTLGLWLLPSLACADGDHRLDLGPEYRRFTIPEYVVSGAVLAGSGVVRWVSDLPSEPRIRGAWPLDAEVRSLLVAETREARDRADFWSDVGWYTSQIFPVAVDALLVAFVLDGWNADVAWQMTAMNYQAFGVSGLLTALSHWFVGRERPSGVGCEEDPSYSALCPSDARHAGLLSGHTSMAFTGAGLTCAHHQHLPLFGGGVWDAVACAGITLTAAATGLLRVAADRHYLSDIVISAAIGFAAGYLLPTYLHYRAGDRVQETIGRRRSHLPDAPGLGFGGTF